MSNIKHPFEPVYDGNSKVLILGTMASVESRRTGFYYGHPRNRFWSVIAAITESETPETIAEKIRLLKNNGIALWDVLESCDIKGSGDSSIKNPITNDFSEILKAANIERIVTNGQKADSLYKRLCESKTGISSICMPSTSPANAAYSLEKLIQQWREIIN